MQTQTPINIEISDISRLEEIVLLNYKIFLGMYENEPYSLEVYKNKLHDKNPVIFIAIKDRQIVGDSIAYRNNDDLYLWIFGVEKENRGLGIGKQLLRKNMEYAKQNSITSISVKVYGVSKEMRKLLEKNNYKITKVEESPKGEKHNVYYYSLQI